MTASSSTFAAGADLLLIANDLDMPAGVFEESVDRVVSAVRAGRIPEGRLESAVARILALKRRYPAVRTGQESME